MTPNVLAQAEERVAPDRAMQAFRVVDGWVRGWEVVPAEAEVIEDVALAAVALRVDGRVIGRGDATGAEGDALELAARRAIAQARATLRSTLDQEPDDRQWASMGARVLVSLELGRTVIPVSDIEIHSDMLGLSPGVHAIVARLGERVAVLTPDEQVSTGVGLARGVGVLTAQLTGEGGDALLTPEQAVERGVTVSRSLTTWVAQPGAGKGPVFLDRGGRVVERGSMTDGAVRTMSDTLAHALIAQDWAGVERYGMAGQRDVVSGRSVPEVAPAFEQALVATALARYAGVREARDPARARRARGQAVALLDDLRVVEPGEPAPWEDPVGGAAVLVALSEFERTGIPVGPELAELETRCVESLEGVYSSVGGFDDSVAPGAQGLVAWALVRRGDERAMEAVRWVYRETSGGSLATQMPFIGWAELEMAGTGAVPAREALRAMRERMWSNQIGVSDTEFIDRDFQGAVVFTSASDPIPTSTNIRPVAFLSTMLRHKDLTEGGLGGGEVLGEILKLSDAMRFVNQLMMDPSSAFLSANPDGCVGGVRRSLWDWRITHAHGAIALLASVEFERSTAAVLGRGN